MLGVGVVLGVDTAGALPTGAGGGKARGMHEVKRATAHHVRTGENQRIGEQQFEEARLCRFSTSLFRAVRCRSSVSYSFCRLLELPEMAYRHPLAFAILRRSARSIPMFRADFLPFTSKIVEHSRYLPSRSRRRAPTSGTMSEPRESTQAMAISATVTPFASAIARNASTSARL